MKGKKPLPKVVTAAQYQKKYAARANPTKKKALPQELVEQTNLIKWFKQRYPKALYNVDLAGSANMGLQQRILHSQRPKRGHPDLMFYEVFKDVYIGLAIEFKKTGIDVAKECQNDTHFQEQYKYLFDLRERCWCAVFVVGIENAKRVISAYMEANEKSIEIINKFSYPNF